MSTPKDSTGMMGNSRKYRDQLDDFADWCRAPVERPWTTPAGNGEAAKYSAIEVSSSAMKIWNTNLGQLPIWVDFERSRFVPAPPTPQVVPFFALVPTFYQWRSLPDMQSGDWPETCRELRWLQNLLLNAQDNEERLKACRQILVWGGNRRWNSGAWPFLKDLCRGSASADSPDSGEHEPFIEHPPDLDMYLRYYSALFDEATRRPDEIQELAAQLVGHPLFRMNSMLTKIHALNPRNDAVPIYDSRVAGAIGTIVETWRRQLPGGALSDACRFPSISSEAAAENKEDERQRTVGIRYPHAPSPGVLRYGSKSLGWRWTEAKMRLSRWMRLVFHDHGEPEDFRWLEASLFVAGYDTRGINRTAAWRGVNTRNNLLSLHI